MGELSREERGARLEAGFRKASELVSRTSVVHKTANDLAARFAALGIDYAIAGANALNAHGFERWTVDVDVLIRREDLERFKEAWLGRGYVEIFKGSKAVRDTIHNTKIDFLITGDYPGDGKPKPVAFPDPADVRVKAYDWDVVSLPTLIDLKLASGITAPHRLHDLSDILRLIQEIKLPREFAQNLNPFVREKYDELWLNAQHATEDY